MPPNRSTFAERVRLLRAKAGLSQKQVAEAVDVGQATVSEWELGKATPAVPELTALCNLFRVCADYVIGRSDFELGLAPDQWIADEDAIATARANPKAKGIRVVFKVPRRMRLLEHDEVEQLKRELRLQ